MKKRKAGKVDAVVIVNVNVVPLQAKKKKIGTHTFKIPIRARDLPIHIIVKPKKESLTEAKRWLAEAVCKD